MWEVQASVKWAYDNCCWWKRRVFGGKQFIMAEQLREKLSPLRHEKALIVKLVSAT